MAIWEGRFGEGSGVTLHLAKKRRRPTSGPNPGLDVALWMGRILGCHSCCAGFSIVFGVFCGNHRRQGSSVNAPSCYCDADAPLRVTLIQSRVFVRKTPCCVHRSVEY